jgi:hypothetical protein
MDFFKSDIFGKLPCPTTSVELFTLLLKGADTNVMMWRGQEDIDWPIHSAAFRRLKIKKEEAQITEKDMQWYERNLLKSATHKGFRHKDGITLSDMELLALLQHHGAATRLIDFTRNVTVALWFTARGCPDKSGLLLGLHTDHMGGYEGEPNELDYNEVFIGMETKNYPQTWQPPTISSRVAAQNSQLLYSSVVHSKLGSLAISPEKNSIMGVSISPQLKKELRSILQKTFAIDYQSLFPDLDGFGYANSFRFDQWANHRW